MGDGLNSVVFQWATAGQRYKTEGMDGELEGSDSEGKKFRRRERRALDIFRLRSDTLRGVGFH